MVVTTAKAAPSMLRVKWLIYNGLGRNNPPSNNLYTSNRWL